MLFHPHVHLLVTAGGLSIDGTMWIELKNPDYLLPVRALSLIFRAKVCAALKKAGLLEQVPAEVWQKNWVVHCQSAGTGSKVLEYLARYLFRVAISNSRLESIHNGQATFRYRDNRSQQIRPVTLPALQFIGRFLQHVLPRGCAKVRYYGIWSPSNKNKLQQARALLTTPSPALSVDSPADPSLPEPPTPAPTSTRCSHCRIGQLITLELLPPERKVPP